MVNTNVSGFMDESIFRRTPAGQREAVFAEKLTDPSARRLLLIVTGATPLHHLLALDRSLVDPTQLSRSLVNFGLIERVQD